MFSTQITNKLDWPWRSSRHNIIKNLTTCSLREVKENTAVPPNHRWNDCKIDGEGMRENPTVRIVPFPFMLVPFPSFPFRIAWHFDTPMKAATTRNWTVAGRQWKRQSCHRCSEIWSQFILMAQCNYFSYMSCFLSVRENPALQTRRRLTQRRQPGAGRIRHRENPAIGNPGDE